MQAGDFATVAELSTKFLSATANNSNQNQVHYFQREYNDNYGGNKRFNRGSHRTNNFRGNSLRGDYNNTSYYKNRGNQNNVRGGHNRRT